MGRYYSGDIEGKFWFAVQSSTSADRFGVEGQSNYLDYYFDTDNLSCIKSELLKIEKNLGEDLGLLDKFFSERTSYNNEILIKFFKENGKTKSSSDIYKMLEEYADYELGNKILKQVEEHGECSFEAEL